MRDTYIIILLFTSALLLALGHNLAIQESWYYLYPVIDIPLHLLGGFVVALSAYISTVVLREHSTEGKEGDISAGRLFSVMILSTVLVVLLWEVFELIFFLTKDAGLSLETLSDILFGLVGGVIGWVAVVLLQRHVD